MRVSDLLGTPVRTESGESLGSVHDVRGELAGGSLRVTGLLVGGAGVAERLGIGALRRRERLRGHDPIPWSAVLRADRRGIVVRDDRA